MKVIITAVLLIGIFASFAVYKTTSQTKSAISSPTVKSEELATKGDLPINEKRFIFIPYWTFQSSISEIDDYDQLIYFGVSVDENGIVKTDPGYTQIGVFIENTPSSKERLLTIRMLNSVTNAKVIKDPALQERIIEETSELAREHQFDGILLDFEMNAIPFEKVINRITDFYVRSGKMYHEKSLTFYVTAYGDTFYRVRPYDIQKIGVVSDGIIIMAYDFHKANGNPGPNFPLSGREVYGYDFGEMIEEYSSVVPHNKLSVAFGWYGYDWKVDDKNVSLGRATSLSLNKITQDFITNCPVEQCSRERDQKSSEQTIRYKDDEGESHIIWFDDTASIEQKKKLLKQKGIGSYGFWAYSYF